MKPDFWLQGEIAVLGYRMRMIFFSVVFVSWGSANVEAQKRIKTTYDSYLVATKNVKSFYSSPSTSSTVPTRLQTVGRPLSARQGEATAT